MLVRTGPSRGREILGKQQKRSGSSSGSSGGSIGSSASMAAPTPIPLTALALAPRALVLNRVAPAAAAAQAGLIEAVAAGDLRLSTPGEAVLAAQAAVAMRVGGAQVLSVRAAGVEVQGSVTVAGDVNVQGTLNTVNTTELAVQDKVVRVARPSGGAGVTEAFLDGAGLLVEPPATDAVERSLRWRRGRLGVAALGGPGGASNEPCWEVRGAGLRLTRARDAQLDAEVSYGLRVNEREELEFYKRWTGAGGQEGFVRLGALGRAAPAPAAAAAGFGLW